jgi:hypothetical protein
MERQETRLQEPTGTSQVHPAELANVETGSTDYTKAFNVLFRDSKDCRFRGALPNVVESVQN